MRYIAILIALVVVLALALIGLPTSGPGVSGPATGSTGTSTPAQGGYGSAIQAAQHAVGVANQDAQSAAGANP